MLFFQTHKSSKRQTMVTPSKRVQRLREKNIRYCFVQVDRTKRITLMQRSSSAAPQRSIAMWRCTGNNQLSGASHQLLVTHATTLAAFSRSLARAALHAPDLSLSLSLSLALSLSLSFSLSRNEHGRSRGCVALRKNRNKW